ncbi:MAG TPA: fibronectin type III domain-containing protein [Candidatus Paceibacterota bacterium]
MDRESQTVEADSVNVNLEVLVCNFNSMCEAVIGETYQSCPSDCAAPTSTPPLPGNNPGGQIPNATTTPIQNEIRSIQVSPDYRSATLTLKTLYASMASISWGETSDYEIGSLAEAWYHNDFKVKLENLEPGTKYYFQIHLKDSLGGTIVYRGEFMTVAIPDSIAPGAPADLSAYLNRDTVMLNWKNPSDRDFAYVRLVRSDIFYPLNPINGKVVYEGRGTYAVDADIVPGKMYFYSLFAYDSAGNLSQPAIVAVYYPRVVRVPSEESAATSSVPGEGSEQDDGAVRPYDPLLDDSYPYVLPDYTDAQYEYTFCNSGNGFTSKGLRDIDVKDITISQNGRNISFTNGKIELEPNLPMRIEIDSQVTSLDGARALAFCINNRIPEVRRGYMFTYSTTTQKFEVEIPTFFSTYSYEFYVGMLKYKSKETVLASGEFTIRHVPDGDRNGAAGWRAGLLKFVQFSFIFLILALIILILRTALLKREVR